MKGNKVAAAFYRYIQQGALQKFVIPEMPAGVYLLRVESMKGIAFIKLLY